MDIKLPTISKMKCKSNHRFLKMELLLSGDIKLNPGLFTGHQLNDSKFEAFNNMRLHIIHLNINRHMHKMGPQGLALYSGQSVLLKNCQKAQIRCIPPF